MGCQGLGEPERREDVGLEGALDLLAREVLDRVVGHLVCRVAHEDIDPPERVHRLLRQGDVGLLGALVGGAQHAGATRGLDLALGLLGVGLLLREVGDGHVGALLGEGDGRGAADPRVAAGDEGALAGQALPAPVAGLAVVRSRPELVGAAGPLLLLGGDVRKGLVRHGSTVGAPQGERNRWGQASSTRGP